MEEFYSKRQYNIFYTNIISSLFFKIFIIFTMIKHYLNVELIYPKSISLASGNIFVIHKDGIDIYDSSMKNLVSNILNFTNSEKLNEDNLASVTISKFDEINDNGIILCIIINKIYIFNYDGKLLYTESKNNIKNKLSSRYFSLIPIKRNDNIFTYMISFCNSDNKIAPLFFEYNNSTKTNTLEEEMTPFEPTISGVVHNINECGVSCQLMNRLSSDVVVCFFSGQTDSIKISYMLIDPDSYELLPSNNSYFVLSSYNFKGMRSIVSTNKQKSLICMYYADTNGYCTTYSINDNSFTENKCYGAICSDNDYCINLNYIKETNKFVFSCIDYHNKLGVVMFDDNLNNTNTYDILIKDAYDLTSASIIYSNDKNDYFFVSDIKYNHINCPYISLNNPNSSVLSYFINSTIPTTTIPSTTVPKTTIPATTVPKTTFPTTTVPKTTITATTIPSTVIGKTTIKPFICTLEKCEKCDESSFLENLCIKCNKNKNYYPINPSLLDINSNYIDCYNNLTKPKNFYFNKSAEHYEICYKSCASCEYGGDGNQNNCTLCDIDLRLEPDKNSKNCVPICTYYYYYNSFNQYKCTTTQQCPDDYTFLVRKKGKCIDSCKKDSIYKYQYNGECYENCTEGTIKDDINHICIVNNIENCTKSSNQLEVYNKETSDKMVKTYMKGFNNTNKHVSLYKNDNYSITIYKNKECINELHLDIDIDLGDCYQNVQKIYDLEGRDLIVEIVEKKNNQKSSIITNFYHPDNGNQFVIDYICNEKVIKVKENIKSFLNGSVSDIDSILYLTNQNINVFNKSSEFFTDLCYHFDSPCDKDIALKDRLLVYYPNISLCNPGCTNIGINLTEMSAICECKYKDLIVENPDKEDNIYEDAINTVSDIFNEVNLVVMGCYKDLFKYDYLHSNTGGVTLLIMNGCQIIIVIVYYFSSSFSINKYIFNITENYILFLNKSPLVNYKIFENKNKSDEQNKSDSKSISKSKSKHKNYPPRKKNSLINIDASETKTINRTRLKVMRTKDESVTENILKQGNLKKIKSFSRKRSKKIKNELFIKSNNSPLITKSKGNIKNGFEDYLSTDFNDMNFHDVSLIDKRLFFDYFCDKIKKKQVILELFYINSPLKPTTIKLLIIILDFEICFVTNAMFINENYISKLFYLKKEENFISFVPRSITRSIYTIFAYIVVSYFIRCLFIDESKMKFILKREKNDIAKMKYQLNLLMKEIKTRHNIFIIATSIFSIFSWFYISCFNHIYPHVKIEWIKSSITIIILIHILSIIIMLIETLLRFVSFEIKSEKMYKASIWLG